MESIEETIIVLVRQNELLFNATTKSYRNAGLRDKCWRSIAEAVNMPGEPVITLFVTYRHEAGSFSKLPV